MYCDLKGDSARVSYILSALQVSRYCSYDYTISLEFRILEIIGKIEGVFG